jgi:hypothetical protein
VVAESMRPSASAHVASLALSLALAALFAPVCALAQEPDAAEGDAAPVGEGPTRIAPTPIESGPRVYMLSVARAPELASEAARVGAAARAALREVEGVDWQTPDRRFLGYDPQTAERLLRARQRLDAGREAYTNLQVAAAIEQFAGAVEDFDAAAAAVEDATDLGRALLLLGASYQLEGRDRDAARIFRRLHIQMPGVRPDPNEFNPEIVQKFQGAAPSDAANPTAQIAVESDPPGAIVYVDFIPRGLTPMTVTGLVSGQHIVRVTRAGAAPFVQPVELRRGGSGAVNAFMEDDPSTPGLHDAFEGIAEAGVERLERNGAIANVASTLELDKVGVIRVAAGTTEGMVDLELLLFDVASGRRLLRGGGEVATQRGDLEAGVQRLVAGGLEAALRAQQAADRERIPARRVVVAPPPPPPPPRESVFKKWWFWTAVGGVVVAATVVGIAVSSSGGTELGRDPGGQVILQF